MQGEKKFAHKLSILWFFEKKWFQIVTQLALWACYEVSGAGHRKFILHYVLKTSLHLPVPQGLKSDTNDVCETRTVFTDSVMCKHIVTSCSAHVMVHPHDVLRHLFEEIHVTIKWGTTFLSSTIYHDSKHTVRYMQHTPSALQGTIVTDSSRNTHATDTATCSLPPGPVTV